MSLKVQSNVILAPYTTFNIGGPARYLVEANSIAIIQEAVMWAKNNGLTFFILGGGSNLLVDDKGFDGLVIRLIEGEIILKPSGFWAFAGVRLATLHQFCLKQGLSGLEWSFGIPGTLGGAIFGNAGAFDQNMAQAIISVEVYNTNTQEMQQKGPTDCFLAYRRSIFQDQRDWIIVGAELKLNSKDSHLIRGDMEMFMNRRKERQPLTMRSAGSVFKNPPGDLSAGMMIESCGLKGLTVGGAQISLQHANFIINNGPARASDVKSLISQAKSAVQKKYNVVIEEEIQYLGSWKFAVSWDSDQIEPLVVYA